MKRVVGLSLIVLFILAAVAAGLFYYQHYYSISGGKPVNAIPPDAAFFIEADVSSGIIDKFSKTPYWKDLQQSNFFKKMGNRLHEFDSVVQADKDLENLLSKEKLIISAHVTKANEFDLLFLMNLPITGQEDFATNMIKKLTGSDVDPVERSYEDVSIKEISLQEGSTFTYSVSKNVFIGSFTAFLTEDAIRQQKVGGKFFGNDKSFNANYAKFLQDDKSGCTIIINYANLPGFLAVFKDINKSSSFSLIDNFASWSFLNLAISDSSFYCLGNTLVKDSSSFTFNLREQKPVDLSLIKILPKKTAAFICTGLSNKETFFNSYAKYLSSSDLNSANRALLNKIKSDYKFSAEDKFYGITGYEFALLVTEPASTNYDNNCYFILKTGNASKAKKMLQALSVLVDQKQNEITKQEKYNGFSLGLIRLQGVIPALYGNVFRRINKMYYTFIGDNIVFANQAASLRSLIDDYAAGSLLVKDEEFKSVSSQLSLTANYFLYSRIPASQYLFKAVLSGEWNHQLDSANNYFSRWRSFAYAIKNENKNLVTQSLLKYNAKKNSDGATLLWSAQLDTSLSMKPQVIYNASANERDIMVQDDANNLYLIDNSGNIIWKKQFPEKIISDIYTIDLYKNNLSEYLFNTANYLFVTDDKGNPVSNYPIRLPAPASNSITAFDFDSTRDYRTYIACTNGKIYGYEGNGKPLSGWNFNYVAGIIHQPVQSFSISGKKYLIASDDRGSIFILDRTGQSVVNVPEKTIRKANADFYTDTNGGVTNFITLDTLGNIINISMNGKTERKTVEAVTLSDNFLFNDMDGNGSPDYVFTEDDQVSSYTNSFALIFDCSLKGIKADGIQYFKLKDQKPVVGIYNESSNKIFLIDYKGNFLKGFPVKGSTPISIGYLTDETKLNLVAGSRDGNIYVYAIE